MTTRTPAADFSQRLDQTAEATEALLGRLLTDDLLPDEIARPRRLMEAIRYSSLGGGKRLRPFLVAESAAVFDVDRDAALLAGAALECIHCYSLIHDDLPAMDNSDLRRGRPTLHKVYDDATAILAGDALLTLAFDIISRDEIHRDPAVRLKLTRAAGPRLRARRHGGRPDARPRRRRPLRRPRTGRRRTFAADEDWRAAALRLHRRRHSGRGDAAAVRRARRLWPRARRSLPDRRRPARRRGRRRSTRQAGRRRRCAGQDHLRHPARHRRRQAAGPRPPGEGRPGAGDLRRQGRRAARRRPLRRPSGRTKRGNGAQGSRRSGASEIPQAVAPGPRGLFRDRGHSCRSRWGSSPSFCCRTSCG